MFIQALDPETTAEPCRSMVHANVPEVSQLLRAAILNFNTPRAGNGFNPEPRDPSGTRVPALARSTRAVDVRTQLWRLIMKKLLILLSLLLVFPFAHAGDLVVPIEMKLSGLVRFVDVVEGRTIFDVDLKGKPGVATGRGVSIAEPVIYDDLPEDNACVYLDDTIPSGKSGAVITAAQIVISFRDGSMIWGNSQPDGYVCYSGFAYAPYDIMGGSGRYEGATGWVAFELDTHGFPPPLILTPETGIGTGEIVIP